MSFDFRTVREPSNDPILRYISKLQHSMAKFITKDQIDQLQGAEDIFGDTTDTDSVIKFQTNLNSTNTFHFDTEYYPPLEPDGNLLRLWLRGTNIGNSLKDWSTLSRTVDLIGDPLLVDGNFDDGTKSEGVLSICTRFNRPTSDARNNEYVIVQNLGSQTMDIDNLTSPGKSYFMRFRLFSLAQQENARIRLWEKTDNATPNDGIHVKIDPDRRLIVVIKKSGIEYKKETATGVMQTNTVYDLWVTFADASGTIHVYLNNVDMTLSNNTDATNWHSDLTNNDIYIFRRGSGDDSGHVYGDLYDFRIYDGKVVSSTEVGYHFTNKWTIVDIPFGQVIISNYWATFDEIPHVGGYDSTGYDSTGFDT